MDTQVEHTNSDNNAATTIVIIISLIAAALVILLATAVSKSITLPLRQIVAMAQNIAAGSIIAKQAGALITSIRGE